MGAHVEGRRRECRGAAGTEGEEFGWGGGVPSPIGQGSGEGALSTPQNFFFNFLPRNSAFFEHSDTIRQFTVKSLQKAQTSVPTQVLVVFH